MDKVNFTGSQNVIAKYSSQNDKLVLKKEAEYFLDKVKNNNVHNVGSQNSNSVEKSETQKGSIIDLYA